jgi:hypothetical protein
MISFTLILSLGSFQGLATTEGFFMLSKVLKFIVDKIKCYLRRHEYGETNFCIKCGWFKYSSYNHDYEVWKHPNTWFEDYNIFLLEIGRLKDELRLLEAELCSSSDVYYNHSKEIITMVHKSPSDALGLSSPIENRYIILPGNGIDVSILGLKRQISNSSDEENDLIE